MSSSLSLPTRCKSTLKGHVGPVHVVRFDSKTDQSINKNFIILILNLKKGESIA